MNRSLRHVASLFALACAASLGCTPSAPAQAVPKTPPPTEPAQPTTPPKTPPTTSPPPATTPKAPPADPPSLSPAAPGGAKPSDVPAPVAAVEYVLLQTTAGDILLELDKTNAPITTANFLAYVQTGFYDGTIFHRIVHPSHGGIGVVQGGGYGADNKQKKTNSPIKNEWRNGLKNTRGTISMARTAAPDSATSQFFLNAVDNPALDRPMTNAAAYAVFGRVVKGMDVVDKLAAIPRKPGTNDSPSTIESITKATNLSADDAKKLIDAK